MIIEKIAKYIRFKGISVYAFENKIGVSRGLISKAIKDNRSIGSNVLENILIYYPDINPEWLLTNRGEMLIESDQETNQTTDIENNIEDTTVEFGQVREQTIRYLREEKERFKVDALFSYIFQKDEENKSLNKIIAEQAKCIGQLEERVFNLNEILKNSKK